MTETFKSVIIYARPVDSCPDTSVQLVKADEWCDSHGVIREYVFQDYENERTGWMQMMERLMGGLHADVLIAYDRSVLWDTTEMRDRVFSVLKSLGISDIMFMSGRTEGVGSDGVPVIGHEDPVLPDGIGLDEDREAGLTHAVDPVGVRFSITLVGDFKCVTMGCGHRIRWDPLTFDKGGIERRCGIVEVYGHRVPVVYREDDGGRDLTILVPTLYIAPEDVEGEEAYQRRFADFIADIMCEDGWVLVTPAIVDWPVDASFGHVEVDYIGDSDLLDGVHVGDFGEGWITLTVNGMMAFPVVTEGEMVNASATWHGVDLKWAGTRDMDGIVVTGGSFRIDTGSLLVAYRVDEDGRRAMMLFPEKLQVDVSKYTTHEDYRDAICDVADVFVGFMAKLGWGFEDPLLLGSVTSRGIGRWD